MHTVPRFETLSLISASPHSSSDIDKEIIYVTSSLISRYNGQLDNALLIQLRILHSSGNRLMTDGIPSPPMNFDAWQPGEPNSANSSESCVHIDKRCVDIGNKLLHGRLYVE